MLPGVVSGCKCLLRCWHPGSNAGLRVAHSAPSLVHVHADGRQRGVPGAAADVTPDTLHYSTKYLYHRKKQNKNVAIVTRTKFPFENT